MRYTCFFWAAVSSLLLQSFTTLAQNACDNASIFISNICLNSSVAVGTQTELGEVFTWYKDGLKKKGPLSGNGGAISYNFAMNSIPDEGVYTIEKSVDGGPATCANKIKAVIVPLPLAQTFSGGGYLCYGVKSLFLQNSQTEVTYEILRNGLVSTSVAGTGGPIEIQVYQEGVYSVRASFADACYDSYMFFGNEVVKSQPLPIQVTGFGTSTADLSWPDSGSHLVEYGLTGFTPGVDGVAGVGGTVISTNTSVTSLSGLAPGKGYDVYVRVTCETGFSGNSIARSFTTGCSAQAVFPVTQNFESVSTSPVPACWTMLDADQDGQLNFSTGAGGFNASNAVLVPRTGDMLVMPALLLNGNQRLRFKIKSAKYYSLIYQVKLSTTTNTPLSYTNVLMKDTLPAGDFVEKTISLAGYTGAVLVSFSNFNAENSNSPAFYLDDVVVENLPACPGAVNLKAAVVSATGASLAWQGSGNFMVEYGAPGFTPGTAATAGAGGTILTTTNNFLTLTGLNAATSYDVYVRQNCSAGGNGFSSNTTKSTFSSFLLCANAVNITQACTITTASVTAGPGLFDFNGFYPDNSCGAPTAGKELLYSFTPVVSGIYYLEITSSSANAYVKHFYKPASAGCNNKSWIGIHNVDVAGVGRYPIGNLLAATTYYFLFDNEFEYAYTQSFKICRADVVASANCTGVFLQNKVPAFSKKKEYLLSADAGLVAELDFAQVSSKLSFGSSEIGLNAGSIRRDFANKEYLDRSFSLNALDSLKGSLGIKFFFKNTELSKLVNEPNDGLADVGSINDLNISVFGEEACGSFTGVGKSITQSANGAYDANSSTVSFTQQVNNKKNTYFFHGGVNPLRTDTSLANIVSICPGSGVTFTNEDLGAGYSYQWQINTGSGFTNLANSDIYGGTSTRIFYMVEPPTSLYGTKFRCLASNGTNSAFSSEKLLRFAITWSGSNGDEWLQPDNWSCSNNYRLPDANTDVIIPGGLGNYPTISTTVSCRNIVIKDGATINMDPAGRLTVTGK